MNMNTQVTFYNNAFGKEKVDVELNSILRAIKSGNWRENTQKYRELVALHGKKSDEADKFKRSNIPGVTVSGTFPNERQASKIGAHSGFISVDFDNLGDEIDTARAELYADPHTYAGFVSVSGTGLCLIVRIDGSKHLESFLGLERYYFAKYGYQIDQACKDINRLRFVSHDSDAYLPMKSKVFDQLPEKRVGRPVKHKAVIDSNDDFAHVLRQIQEQRIDLTTSYEAWIEIGMAIKSKYGDSGAQYFHAVSQYHPGYDEAKTTRKYESFSTTGGVTIASFYHHAKQAGLQTRTPESKAIATVATFAKKGRRTPEQAIEQLEKIDGIAPERSREIVQRVFSAPPGVDGTSESDEDLLHQVEEFLRRETKIVFNEITLKYEQSGKPLTDRDVNTIYLDCKRVVSKVSKDLVLSCIDSDRTSTVNPVHAFFTKHGAKKPVGRIQQLANCVKTTNGNADYVSHFMRKWLIGSVAMWHKHHSPLMLVLAGFAQNTGKTHFFRYILPNELQPYFAEAELTGDKDENLLMCNKLIILNDEMSNKSRKDIAMVKKLCSAQWFNLRRPYGRMSEDFRRIAALAGTSNDLALLNDPSGNRRIIPIDVAAIDHDEYNSIDKVELWVEAFHAYKAGEEYHLTSADIAYLGQNTSEFEEPSLEYEGIMAYFTTGDSQYLTNTQIKSYIEIRTKQRLSSKKLGMELKRLGFDQVVQKIDGKVARVYPMKERFGVVVSTFLEDSAPF
jgi:hypothetical protein